MDFRKLSECFGVQARDVDLASLSGSAFYKHQVQAAVIVWPQVSLFLPRPFPPGAR